MRDGNAIVTNANNLGGGRHTQRLITCNGNMDNLRPNSVLIPDTWKEIQRDHIVPMAQIEMKAYLDLVDEGLTHKLAGIGKTVTEWVIEGDTSDANVSMNTLAWGQQDLVDYEMDSAPVPVIFRDFELDWRMLNASQIEGVPIDLSNSDAAIRKVGVASENIVVNGHAHGLGGQTIYGYTTHPNRIPITGFENRPFTIGDDNVEDMVLAMVKGLESNDYRGPFNLYIPTGYATELYKRFGDGSAEVLNDWLKKIDLIKKVTPTAALAPGNMVMVQMDRTVIDLAIGLNLEPIEWEIMGGMGYGVRVITAFVPRIKRRRARAGGYQTGIAHMRFQPHVNGTA